MKRGRPTRSDIRQNIVEILALMGQGYGYEIFKTYVRIFPKATMRVIYYHLKKGLALEEFTVAEIKKEKGDFSWGGEVEKVYYGLGAHAKVAGDSRVKGFFAKQK
ncbi:hypothetical protein JXB02_06110 [Candidatus Woesearchaeota archaeon]|nr:hypothetical protein [Candidatus Woesearchaeota archaeon]